MTEPRSRDEIERADGVNLPEGPEDECADESDSAAGSRAEDIAEPPNAEPPNAEPPNAEPPNAEPPNAEPPNDEPPNDEPPNDELPNDEPPNGEPPNGEPPNDEQANDEQASDELVSGAGEEVSEDSIFGGPGVLRDGTPAIPAIDWPSLPLPKIDLPEIPAFSPPNFSLPDALIPEDFLHGLGRVEPIRLSGLDLEQTVNDLLGALSRDSAAGQRPASKVGGGISADQAESLARKEAEKAKSESEVARRERQTEAAKRASQAKQAADGRLLAADKTIVAVAAGALGVSLTVLPLMGGHAAVWSEHGAVYISALSQFGLAVGASLAMHVLAHTALALDYLAEREVEAGRSRARALPHWVLDSLTLASVVTGGCFGPLGLAVAILLVLAFVQWGRVVIPVLGYCLFVLSGALVVSGGIAMLAFIRAVDWGSRAGG